MIGVNHGSNPGVATLRVKKASGGVEDTTFQACDQATSDKLAKEALEALLTSLGEAHDIVEIVLTLSAKSSFTLTPKAGGNEALVMRKAAMAASVKTIKGGVDGGLVG